MAYQLVRVGKELYRLPHAKTDCSDLPEALSPLNLGLPCSEWSLK